MNDFSSSSSSGGDVVVVGDDRSSGCGGKTSSLASVTLPTSESTPLLRSAAPVAPVATVSSSRPAAVSYDSSLRANDLSTQQPRRIPSRRIMNQRGAKFSFCLVAGIVTAFTFVTRTRPPTQHYHDHHREQQHCRQRPLLVAESPPMTTQLAAAHRQQHQQHQQQQQDDIVGFPSAFVWGTATSSYQIEGGIDERGLTNWDAFCQQPDAISDHSNGSVACDHYHLYRHDIRLMKDVLGVNAYRFSIAWSRILPTGLLMGRNHSHNTSEHTNSHSVRISQVGVDFYNGVIDTLLAHGIEPWVTLFHWDLPLVLEEQFDGWLGPETVEAFADYARLCFTLFGDRVKHWITLNEPWTVAVNGYGTGVHAPGHQSADEPYLVAHNLLLAHGRAVRIYRSEGFQAQQQGQIGISNCGDYRYPNDPTSKDDIEASKRAMAFQFGWFTDPLVRGDYPDHMKQYVGENRLPTFTRAERELLRGSLDFVGLNYYSSLRARDTSQAVPLYNGYWSDMRVDLLADSTLEMNAMGWTKDPDGLYHMLLRIRQSVDGIPIYITETGTAEDGDDSDGDRKRQQYFEGHLRACFRAIADHARSDRSTIRGFFAWSFLDNFEWQYGYTRRFGMIRTDFRTQQRTPRLLTTQWYAETIRQNGNNLIY